MQKPLNDLVAAMVEKLNETVREEFEERAGILEFQATRSRAYAEALALIDVIHKYPHVLAGVTAMQVDLNGGSRWLLTTDEKVARQRLALAGGVFRGTYDLDSVIERQYGGMALLTAFAA